MDRSALSLRFRSLRIWRMVRKELRQLLRDPRTKRVIFLSPIIQLLAFGYAVNTDVRNVRTFLVDQDRTPESRLLADAFTAGGYFRIIERSLDPAKMTDALDHGAVAVGLQIPAGFAGDLRAGRGPAVQILVDGTNSNTATVAQGYAVRIVQDFALKHGLEGSGARGGAPVTSTGIQLRTRAFFNPDLTSQDYNVPAVIGLILMIMSLLLTALAVVREREVGTLDQLLVSPLTSGELMIGKTLPVAGIAMVQLVLVTTVALFWFRVPFRGAIPSLVLAALLFILAGLSFGLLISAVSRTQQEAFLLMFLFLLPAIILSGMLYPVDTMPLFFQDLTLLNPLRHFLLVVREIFLKGAGLAELWPQYLYLALMAGAGLWFAARQFRRSVE